MLVSILNVNVDIDMHIDIERGPKKFFQLLVGHAHVCVFGITGANARGGCVNVESTNFQCGLEKFDVERCVRRYVEGRD